MQKLTANFICEKLCKDDIVVSDIKLQRLLFTITKL